MSSTEANLVLHRRSYSEIERAHVNLAIRDLIEAKKLLLASNEVLKAARIGCIIAELEGDLNYGCDR
jgi:hypothetical protein